jgi:hypothetical protein
MRAVPGIGPTLRSLGDSHVQRLLLADTLVLPGLVCERCGQLAT